MANIMSSLPADHTLLGGHSGALIWLQRFMDLLPPTPASPLPLLTAPVLVAFLSGAGHMLAKKYPSEFTSLLAVMKDDLLHRLDETPIGVPSATRLKKVLEDIGLEGLRRDLPQGAVAELYNANEGGGGGSGMTSSHSQGLSSSFSPFGQKTLGGISGADGGNHSSTSTNRGDIVSSQDLAFHVSSTASPLPVDNTNNMSEEGPVTSPFGSGLFGSSSAASSASPFGGQSSLFGTTSVAAPTQSPFGGGAVQSSGFGSMTGAFASNRAGGSGLSSGFMSAPAPATMTTTIAAPSPFSSFPTSGTSPFGMAVPTNPSPFGATASSSSTFGAAPTPSASAFGALAPSPSPFGTGGAASNPSPFGTAPSAFGTAPASSPFSSAPFGSSPFGGNTTTSAQGPSPFSMSNSGTQGFGQGGGGGDSSKQPCKFFASGTCNFGDRCKFSHELGASQGSGGSSNMSAFGVSSRQPTNTFGGGGNKPPCKFFASGSCRNGNSCQFSHELPGVGGGGGTSGFGSSSTPFGGGFGQAPNPSPFSGGVSSGGGFGNFGLGTTNPSPFSASSALNNPFGGPRR